MRIILLLLFSCLLTTYTLAQKYFTKQASVSFFSSTPIEDIEAHNNKGSSVFDLESRRIEFAVLVKAFIFEKALMQEHFNENYMESDTYPKAVFKGNFVNYKPEMLNGNDMIDLEVAGTLSMHGVSNDIKVDVQMKKQESGYHAECDFKVTVADYNIKIPKVVRENIAKEIEIRIVADYQLFK